MKNFIVVGLKKDQFRGNHQPMTASGKFEAETEKEAGNKFEKKNPEYNTQVVTEMPAKHEKNLKQLESAPKGE